MKKRIFSILTAVAMLVAMGSVGAVSVSAACEATVTVSSATGVKGDVVEVTVSISENSYLVNADMFLSYDPEKLELDRTYYADPDGDEGDTLCYQVNAPMFPTGWMVGGNEKEAGTFYFLAASSGNSGITTGGEMFRVAFRILTEEAGDVAVAFSANPAKGNDGTGELDEFGYPIDTDMDFSIVNGVVTVETPAMLGDVDGNGMVDMMDAFMVYSAVSTGSANSNETMQTLADMDGNGVVDMMDAFAVYRIASGAA